MPFASQCRIGLAQPMARTPSSWTAMRATIALEEESSRGLARRWFLEAWRAIMFCGWTKMLRRCRSPERTLRGSTNSRSSRGPLGRKAWKRSRMLGRRSAGPLSGLPTTCKWGIREAATGSRAGRDHWVPREQAYQGGGVVGQTGLSGHQKSSEGPLLARRASVAKGQWARWNT